MSLQEQQNLLARLYTDGNFRQQFLTEPEKTSELNNLSQKEIAEILAIIPDELDFFADSLFWKRLREVEKILPETRKALADTFENLFREFSKNFTPQTVKKHLEEAISFCDFLQEKTEVSEHSRDVAKFEKARLEFFGYEKTFVFYRSNKIFSSAGKRKTLAIWIRLNGKVRHFSI